jgi:hypothetical protein
MTQSGVATIHNFGEKLVKLQPPALHINALRMCGKLQLPRPSMGTLRWCPNFCRPDFSPRVRRRTSPVGFLRSPSLFNGHGTRWRLLHTTRIGRWFCSKVLPARMGDTSMAKAVFLLWVRRGGARGICACAAAGRSGGLLPPRFSGGRTAAAAVRTESPGGAHRAISAGRGEEILRSGPHA